MHKLISRYSHIVGLCAFLTLASAIPGPINAQEAQELATEKRVKEIENKAQIQKVDKRSIPDFDSFTEKGLKEYARPKFKPRAYIPATMENLINLYWGMGVNKTSNPQEIDMYMRATECKIYDRFRYNEFEWRKIRSIAKDVIDVSTKVYYNRLEFTQPIILGEYDMQRGTFPISRDTAFNGTRRVQLGGTAFGDACLGLNRGGVTSVLHHPSKVEVILNHPLTLTFVKTPEELAQEFVALHFALNQSNPLNSTPRPRVAYINLKILITNFKEKIIPKRRGGNQRVIFFGYLEGYEVFADKDLTISLYESRKFTEHLDKLNKLNEINSAEPESTQKR